ncbi:hypothetical protein ACTZOT_27435, partial [Klebsiella pneumoniae]
MSRRHIFTERQRAALFDLPTDELSLLKFYTLGDDDLERHCCKVSDEAAFCLIQRPYISKTLLT